MARLKRQGSSYRTIGKLFGESGSTVLRCLRTNHYDKVGGFQMGHDYPVRYGSLRG